MKRSALILALVLGACASPPPGTPPPSPPQPVIRGFARSADGLSIAYETAGQEPTALLFVHGWCCNRGFFRGQMQAFSGRYRVVALDLGGHGASGRERGTWTLPSLADDVVAVANSLGLDRVILVGHSLGGPVSLIAASRMPGRVLGVVGIDTLHDAEFVWPPSLFDRLAAGYEADFAGEMARAVVTLFPPSADPALVTWVTVEAGKADKRAAIALMRAFESIDLKSAFSAAGVPIRVINAAPRGSTGFATALDTNRKYADFDAVILEGVGHYPMLERPAEFDAHLRTVVEKLDAR